MGANEFPPHSLAVGFVANLCVKPVDPKYYLKQDEA